jgi:hypothetical protein
MADNEAEEIQERERMLFDDPREKPRDGVTIIRLHAGRLDLETFADLFIQHLRMLRPEATRVCLQEGGILFDNIAPEVAKALAQDLQAHGEECFLIPAADLVPLPRAKPIHAVSLTEEDVSFADATGHVESVPWGKSIVLALGHVLVEQRTDKVVHRGLLTQNVGMAGALGGLTGADLAGGLGGGVKHKMVTTQDERLYLDFVALGPLRRYRIDAGECDYSVLGDQRQLSSVSNLRLLADLLLRHAPQLRTNFDAPQKPTQAATPLPKLSLHGMDAVVQWLVNLVRFHPER